MKWDYRVVANKDNDCYDLVECYYKENEGGIQGYILANVNGWEHIEDMKGSLYMMLEAFDKPTLEIVNGVLKE